jgi:hypothetical protein
MSEMEQKPGVCKCGEWIGGVAKECNDCKRKQKKKRKRCKNPECGVLFEGKPNDGYCLVHRGFRKDGYPL